MIEKNKMEIKKKKRIWIAWETQRRTKELAEHLKCRLFIIEYNGIMRFPLSIIKSIKILIAENPDKIFVQNPSMILALIGCIYKKIYKKYLIVDRHSNFMITKKYWNPFYILMFKSLNGLTIKNADLTIVTNSFIANLVKNKGGNAFILQDKIPQMQKTQEH